MLRRFFLSLVLLPLLTPLLEAKDYDLVVYGGSPAGLMAAIAAAREKASVVVIEPSPWIGGMVAGGLSSSDIGKEETIGGLAREFYERCGKPYGVKVQWYAEPHVYQQTFREMVDEAGVEVITGQALEHIERMGTKITSITTSDHRTFAGRVFIDATYEGDLMAHSGVSYLVGREARETYQEPLAGFRREKVRDFSAEVMTHGCACVGETGPHYVHGAPMKISGLDAQGRPIAGVTTSTAEPGTADKLTQSYNFRLCVTQNPANRVPWPQPAHYDATRYELLLRLVQAYPGIPFSRLVHLGKLANGKADLNAQGLFSTDYVGGNADYPDGDAATRTRIVQDHLDYLQGFFWFLAHDERLPLALRVETQSWGLCRDEFTDNQHWPYALYVREARRMIGETVLTQQDVQRKVTKADSIGMGSFIIDSHIVQRLLDTDGTVIDEGAFDAPARPYAMPYSTLVPRRAECTNLLVPVCLSASHIAYCSLRMEPVYMAMGHASGLAAVAAIHEGKPVQEIDIPALQTKLRAQKQVLELPGAADLVTIEQLKGIVVDDEAAEFTGAWTASSFGGGGVEGSSRHDMNGGKGTKTARFTVPIPADGDYEVRLSYTPAPNRATKVPITIEHAGEKTAVQINQRLTPTSDHYFVSVARFHFTQKTGGVITISNTGTDGYVVADAVQLLPIP